MSHCSVCGVKSLSILPFSKHLFKHLNELPYLCFICVSLSMQNQPKSYFVNNTVFVYENGSDRSPVKVRSHLCGECSGSFMQFEHCALHIQKKIKDKFYQCPLCLLCFSDINVCSEHKETCQLQKYNCAECGIILSTECDNFILEPLLFYNLADIVPDSTSENIFEKCRLFFSVKKYPIIHNINSPKSGTSLLTVNPINTSVANAVTKCCVCLDYDAREDNVEHMASDSIFKTHQIETVNSKISQLKTSLPGGFLSNNNGFTLPKSKALNACFAGHSAGFLNGNMSKDIIIRRTNNTVSCPHCYNLRKTSPDLAVCKKDNRISVLENLSNLPIANNHVSKKIEKEQKNVYNLKKLSVVLHKLPLHYQDCSLKNACKLKHNIKDLSVLLFRLPKNVRNYKSYKTYCQSQARKEALLKQKNKPKDKIIFVNNILPSAAEDDCSLSSVEWDTSDSIDFETSSSHVGVPSNSNLVNFFGYQLPDSSHQISETFPERSSLMVNNCNISNGGERDFDLESSSSSSSGYCTALNDYTCDSFSEKPKELQSFISNCQPITKFSQPPALIPYHAEECDILSYNNPCLLSKSVDDHKTDVPNSFKSSKPFKSWKTDEQLKYLRYRIKYINNALEVFKCGKKRENV